MNNDFIVSSFVISGIIGFFIWHKNHLFHRNYSCTSMAFQQDNNKLIALLYLTNLQWVTSLLAKSLYIIIMKTFSHYQIMNSIMHSMTLPIGSYAG